MNPTAESARPVLVHASAVVDAEHVLEAPGAILLQHDRIRAVGSPESIGQVSDAQRLELHQHVVLPALVNAHAHLDLSHIGPVSYNGDFPAWVERVRRERAVSEQDIAASVTLGATLARAGGTAIVGDIAGVRSPVPITALRRSGLRGVSFLEIFGIGRAQNDAINAMCEIVDSIERDADGVVLGIQPHAPYSCGMAVYEAAASLGLPVATHLAETLDELRFVDQGDGPLRDMLQRIGVWDESLIGHGCHPVELLKPLLDRWPQGRPPMLAAHVNYIDEQHMDMLAAMPIAVAYCPRASAYFGHPHEQDAQKVQSLPHQYRAMIEAGVCVALGTDSILCLDTADRISVLDEMRLLHQRDGTEPRTLLRMATIKGAEALGLARELVTLAPGPTAGVIAVAGATLGEALASKAAPRWLAGAGCRAQDES